ncbi:hypothetical protein MF133_01895 [Aeromonas caviae]|uniref:hypothetical protein n=1 Tax=Aeromonas caviae TaxID=648 RepID=UPI001EF00AAC|nr:hypothetical protein [Aeromonas caviae]ULH03210.1 hypothetical protein MF133_01895 [Aeromonas caviae]WDV26433.1 hypothetical protein PVK35_11360 [Aeromonas caviae]
MRKVEISCVAWIDLLAYGSQISASGFNPAHESAATAIDRLDRLHQAVSEKANRYFPTLAMNDGIIAYRDLSPRAHSVTYDFLSRSIDLFHHVNNIDMSELGHPGARMVVAPGFRVRRTLNFDKHLNEGIGKRIKQKLQEGAITPEQAVNEALKARQFFDSTPELQGNFALTRAYLADESGSAAGLGGANCFIDLSLFSSPHPDWISFSKTIEWSSRGMAATFGCLEKLDHERASAVQAKGILDAFEIAKTLSKDPDIETKLRQEQFRIVR